MLKVYFQYKTLVEAYRIEFNQDVYWVVNDQRASIMNVWKFLRDDKELQPFSLPQTREILFDEIQTEAKWAIPSTLVAQIRMDIENA